ncbi:MAG: hypothetical protein JXR94_14295 [Candidatus Hydrogenedentes bacterium]|nr:hypothetical protein [Candidatus Hydrogenedentota bacterium]
MPYRKGRYPWILRAQASVLCVLVFIATAERCAAGGFLPSGLTYVWWRFDKPEFEDLQIDFEILGEIPQKPGLYLQFYQGEIGDIGFYFGLQTDVYDPDRGWRGKGILFSRWGTRDLANVRSVSSGWVQSSGHEGDFVGIRRNYAWTDHRYRFHLARVDEDGEGVWYGLFLLDYDTGSEDYAGAIRFPKRENRSPKVRDGGGTWIEVYSAAGGPDDLPYVHLSISGAYADHRRTPARRAVSNYSNVENTDVFYDSESKRIHMLFGKGVTRKHEAGRLF